MGKFPGAENYAVRGKSRVVLEGLEDWETYEDNYRAYLHSKNVQGLLFDEFQRLISLFDHESKLVFNERLLRFHQDYRVFIASEYENLNTFLPILSEHLSLVSDKEGYRLALDFLKMESQIRNYPKEKSFRIAKAILSRFEKEVFSKLQPRDQFQVNQLKQRLNTSQIEAWDFISQLLGIVENYRFSFPVKDEVRETVEFFRELHQVPGDVLFYQLLQLSKDILEKLSVTNEERLLIENYQDIHRLGRLVELKLVRDEWAEMEKDLPHLMRKYRLKPEAIYPFEVFYKTALLRDEKMFQTILNILDRRGESSMAVTMGGFHTEGLKRLLEKNKISYAVITPSITSLSGEETYHEVMKGNLSYLNHPELSLFENFTRHTVGRFFGGLTDEQFQRVFEAWGRNLVKRLEAEERLLDYAQYQKYFDSLYLWYFQKHVKWDVEQKAESLDSARQVLAHFTEEVVKRQPASGFSQAEALSKQSPFSGTRLISLAEEPQFSSTVTFNESPIYGESPTVFVSGTQDQRETITSRKELRDSIKRRSFLRASVLGLAATVVPDFVNAQEEVKDEDLNFFDEEPKPWVFDYGFLETPASTEMDLVDNFGRPVSRMVDGKRKLPREVQVYAWNPETKRHEQSGVIISAGYFRALQPDNPKDEIEKFDWGTSIAGPGQWKQVDGRQIYYHVPHITKLRGGQEPDESGNFVYEQGVLRSKSGDWSSTDLKVVFHSPVIGQKSQMDISFTLNATRAFSVPENRLAIGEGFKFLQISGMNLKSEIGKWDLTTLKFYDASGRLHSIDLDTLNDRLLFPPGSIPAIDPKNPVIVFENNPGIDWSKRGKKPAVAVRLNPEMLKSGKWAIQGYGTARGDENSDQITFQLIDLEMKSTFRAGARIGKVDASILYLPADADHDPKKILKEFAAPVARKENRSLSAEARLWGIEEDLDVIRAGYGKRDLVDEMKRLGPFETAVIQADGLGNNLGYLGNRLLLAGSLARQVPETTFYLVTGEIPPVQLRAMGTLPENLIPVKHLGVIADLLKFEHEEDLKVDLSINVGIEVTNISEKKNRDELDPQRIIGKMNLYIPIGAQSIGKVHVSETSSSGILGFLPMGMKKDLGVYIDDQLDLRSRELMEGSSEEFAELRKTFWSALAGGREVSATLLESHWNSAYFQNAGAFMAYLEGLTRIRKPGQPVTLFAVVGQHNTPEVLNWAVEESAKFKDVTVQNVLSGQSPNLEVFKEDGINIVFIRPVAMQLFQDLILLTGQHQNGTYTQDLPNLATGDNSFFQQIAAGRMAVHDLFSADWRNIFVSDISLGFNRKVTEASGIRNLDLLYGGDKFHSGDWHKKIRSLSRPSEEIILNSMTQFLGDNRRRKNEVTLEETYYSGKSPERQEGLRTVLKELGYLDVFGELFGDTVVSRSVFDQVTRDVKTNHNLGNVVAELIVASNPIVPEVPSLTTPARTDLLLTSGLRQEKRVLGEGQVKEMEARWKNWQSNRMRDDEFGVQFEFLRLDQPYRAIGHHFYGLYQTLKEESATQGEFFQVDQLDRVREKFEGFLDEEVQKGILSESLKEDFLKAFDFFRLSDSTINEFENALTGASPYELDAEARSPRAKAKFSTKGIRDTMLNALVLGNGLDQVDGDDKRTLRPLLIAYDQHMRSLNRVIGVLMDAYQLSHLEPSEEAFSIEGVMLYESAGEKVLVLEDDFSTENIFDLFRLSAERQFSISEVTLYELREWVGALDEAAVKELWEGYLDLNRLDMNLNYVKRKLYDIGLLHRFYPELEEVEKVYDTSGFHHFNVAMHQMFVGENFEKLPETAQGYLKSPRELGITEELIEGVKSLLKRVEKLETPDGESEIQESADTRDGFSLELEIAAIRGILGGLEDRFGDETVVEELLGRLAKVDQYLKAHSDARAPNLANNLSKFVWALNNVNELKIFLVSLIEDHRTLTPDERLAIRLEAETHDLGKDHMSVPFRLSHQMRSANIIVPELKDRLGLPPGIFRTLQFLNWYHQHFNYMARKKNREIDLFVESPDGWILDWVERESVHASRLKIARLFSWIDRLGLGPDNNHVVFGLETEKDASIRERHEYFFREMQAYLRNSRNDQIKKSAEFQLRREADDERYLTKLKDRFFDRFGSEFTDREEFDVLADEFITLKTPEYVRRLTTLTALKDQLVFYKQLKGLNVGTPLILTPRAQYHRADHNYFEVIVGLQKDLSVPILDLILGVIGKHGFSIMEPDVRTTDEGLVLNHFRLVRQDDQEVTPEMEQALTDELRDVLVSVQKEEKGDERESGKIASSLGDLKASTFRESLLESQISFSDSYHTAGKNAEIKTADRPFLLYSIVRLLSRAYDFDIFAVPGATQQFGAVINIVFKSRDGSAISEDVLEELKNMIEDSESLFNRETYTLQELEDRVLEIRKNRQEKRLSRSEVRKAVNAAHEELLQVMDENPVRVFDGAYVNRLYGPYKPGVELKYDVWGAMTGLRRPTLTKTNPAFAELTGAALELLRRPDLLKKELSGLGLLASSPMQDILIPETLLVDGIFMDELAVDQESAEDLSAERIILLFTDDAQYRLLKSAGFQVDSKRLGNQPIALDSRHMRFDLGLVHESHSNVIKASKDSESASRTVVVSQEVIRSMLNRGYSLRHLSQISSIALLREVLDDIGHESLKGLTPDAYNRVVGFINELARKLVQRELIEVSA